MRDRTEEKENQTVTYDKAKIFDPLLDTFENTDIQSFAQIDNVFRRGISKARMGRLTFAPGKDGAEQQTKRVLKDFDKESLSHADSLQFIRQGLIENPDTLRFPHAAVDSVNLAPQITAGSK